MRKIVDGRHEASPDDYSPDVVGPYTPPQPNLPDPFRTIKPPKYAWGTFITVAVLAVLFVVGLAVSASRDDEVVQIPNTVLNPTPTPSATPGRFTPQAHKPGPPVRGVEEYMPDDGSYLVGVQIEPGTYSAVCAEELCSWTRAEYIPDLGVEVGVAYSYYLPPKDRPVVGSTVIVKILPGDSSFVTHGFTPWVRS